MRAVGSYIYEEFVETQGTDVKVQIEKERKGGTERGWMIEEGEVHDAGVCPFYVCD